MSDTTPNPTPVHENAPPWPKGRYDWIGTIFPVNAPSSGVTLHACEDCGAVVRKVDRDLHDRHHATQNHTAKAIGVLVASHVGERPHAKYDVMERIGQNPAAWIGHKEIAHFAAELMVDDEPPPPAPADDISPVCPSCGFTGRQANVWEGGILVRACRDPWHDPSPHGSTPSDGHGGMGGTA